MSLYCIRSRRTSRLSSLGRECHEPSTPGASRRTASCVPSPSPPSDFSPPSAHLAPTSVGRFGRRRTGPEPRRGEEDQGERKVSAIRAPCYSVAVTEVHPTAANPSAPRRDLVCRVQLADSLASVLTPEFTQDQRKVQNRIAQREFRQRKQQVGCAVDLAELPAKPLRPTVHQGPRGPRTAARVEQG